MYMYYLTILAICSLPDMTHNDTEDYWLSTLEPVPSHIDVASVLEDLESVEAWLPFSVDTLKTFRWGFDPKFSSTVLLTLRGYKAGENGTDRLKLTLENGLLFNFDIMYHPDNVDCIENLLMSENDFLYVANTISNILDLNLTFNSGDSAVISGPDNCNYWEINKRYAHATIEYLSSYFRLMIDDTTGKIRLLGFSPPVNTPPSVIPQLNMLDAFTAAKNYIMLVTDGYLQDEQDIILLHEDPTLTIIDKPWITVQDRYDDSQPGGTGSPSIIPSISSTEPELQHARLYWDVPLYFNLEELNQVHRFFVDAITGDIAGSILTFKEGELIPGDEDDDDD